MDKIPPQFHLILVAFVGKKAELKSSTQQVNLLGSFSKPFSAFFFVLS